jgi:hypothetical protein
MKREGRSNMNDFINYEPYIEKTFTNNCRDCGKEFTINAQCHPKTGAPVTFISKYCKVCNIKLRDAFNTTVPINGTINNISSAKIAQKNVEGLEESIQTLATSIVNAKDEFGAFKKHAEHDIEQNKLKLENFLDVQIGVNDRVNERIADNILNLNVFKSSQAEFNTKQSDFNISVLQLVREIHKTLIVGFLLLIILMLVTWSYLTYTHFNH